MASQSPIDNYLAHLDDKIIKTDNSIKSLSNRAVKLRQQKAAILKAKEIYPDLIVYKNVLCSAMVWDKVQCMTIDAGSGWHSSDMTVRFSVGFKDNIDDMNVFVAPLEHRIAYIGRGKYNVSRNGNSIQVFDYKQLIPDTCPNKATFVRRIKKALIRVIQSQKLTVEKNSFDIDNIEKLLLLT